MSEQKWYSEKNTGIQGDHIYITCQKPGKWILFRKSEKHRAKECHAQKDAKAIILKPYTNVKNS